MRNIQQVNHKHARTRPGTVLLRRAAGIAFLVCASVAAGPLDPPPPERVREAQAIVRDMQSAERGPYTRIRWFCNDGTVHPPTPYACKDRGGGRQHAEYSPARERLAELGWNVGTIVAALDWQALWRDDERRLRLRELPVERYLVDVDDGWVLRRARHYRGRVQVEGEEKQGRKLLVQLMSQADWISGNFLVAAEVVRVVPHGTGEDLTRSIRRTAQDIAEKDKSFERLRVEIHSVPTAASAERVRAWMAAGDRSPELLKEATELARELDRLFGSAGRKERLAAARKRLARFALAEPVVKRLQSVDGEDELSKLERLGDVMYSVRGLIADKSATPTLRLELFDLLRELEAELRVLSAGDNFAASRSRAELARAARALARAAYGTGLFSGGELSALSHALAPLVDGGEIPLPDYIRATRSLTLAGTWAVGSVRYAFADVLVRYAALEPRAAYFVDDLLRGSVLLPLAGVGGRLSADAQRLAGVRRQVFGSAASDLVALNPGLARGPLRVLSEKDMAAEPLPV
ncbi:MAG: hypothetical protein R3174_06790, partial [Gammaproteobacteria bacterium]|nr:hypothetical protein [Gammaproteobacteria bacterium]